MCAKKVNNCYNNKDVGFMRAWFNGRMGASQALDEGSIPFARSF